MSSCVVYPLECIRPKQYGALPATSVQALLAKFPVHPSNREPKISITKTSYVSHILPRHAILSKRDSSRRKAASGIVPQNEEQEATSPIVERLLPLATRIKTTNLPTGGPYRFMQRKRKLAPPEKDHVEIFYFTDSNRRNSLQIPSCSADNSASRDIRSVSGHALSRRKWIQPPVDHLKAKSFDGGAAAIPGRGYDSNYLHNLRLSILNSKPIY
ncbi:uncharacterized protein LOC141907603 [Tubulanus polymorphus]|uniref:uncharacterized protein LOC141907603 n=1 Tax=Tubulanus polymorphus TaxID=672921 RepID=UPI003DA2C733